MSKLRLIAHFLRRGYGPRIAFKLARKRYDDTNLARRMLEQTIFGSQK